ncbi:MAG: ferrous iron transport protein B [Oscillospiraceae bacterium]|nr:ferrous iron transport protein B [Oscillospiraceae bacterium]
MNNDSFDKTIALAGNPNVGKSTVFNALTGLHQHTGNWAGKTVETASGFFKTKAFSYRLVDIPGTYSLIAHSAEEEAARDYICFGKADAAVVVCDATCLERGLNLVLQVMEICPKTLVCVNMLDEAKRAGIKIDLKLLEKELGVPVAGITAHKKRTLKILTDRLDELCSSEAPKHPRKLKYIKPLEAAVRITAKVIEHELSLELPEIGIPAEWAALRLIDGSMVNEISERCKRSGRNILENSAISEALAQSKKLLSDNGINEDILQDKIVGCIYENAEEICKKTVTMPPREISKADRILTSRALGFPIMILLLLVVFWITIIGANYPSEYLGIALFWLGDRMGEMFQMINAPDWLSGIIVDGAYRVLAWVVSVMLPPMAIFFPLFTLLEDLGYLPRVAYNLDKPFHKCSACGKQALCMCMGFGCNAAGVTGARIIDSRRERLIAILTNSLVPCNGRFPMILALISAFFVSGAKGSGILESLLSAVIFTAVIVLGIMMTFLTSKILAKTLLKGEPSSFTLELPPFRKPQVGKILIRSCLDRTVFVLGRAAAVAAPAGAVIWLLANINVFGNTLLSYITGFFEPFGQLLGMDGAIITAFLLGIPANEIVIPLIVMIYEQSGVIAEISTEQLYELFTQNGWTVITAICVIIFTLFHFPCSTTLLTIKKEAGGWKWAALAFFIPLIIGVAFCLVINLFSMIFTMA